MTDRTGLRSVPDLLAVMAALRTPGSGCPWDLEQSFRTIAPYTIEEAYEVADAIERGDLADLKDELGDLLLQVVYHARLAEEGGAFAFADVVDGIVGKMVRRHPHVFGDAAARSAGAAKGFWEKQKEDEKAAKARVSGGSGGGVLDGVALGLPALTRAIKLQDKAARVGFDWPSLAPVLAKMNEELRELEEAIAANAANSARPAPGHHAVKEAQAFASAAESSASGAAPGDTPTAGKSGDMLAAVEKIKEEFGDLLFVMANVARHLEIDPETALRSANQKFTRRFARIEGLLADRGKTPADLSLAEMDALWDQAKAEETRSSS